MLDKKSKQILKALNKASNNSDYVNGSKALMSYLPRKFTNDQVNEILWYLESKDYIECGNAEDTIWDIYIKYEAKNYKEFNWIKTKDFIYKSVLVPIFTSIATSAAIYLLTTYCFKH